MEILSKTEIMKTPQSVLGISVIVCVVLILAIIFGYMELLYRDKVKGHYWEYAMVGILAFSMTLIAPLVDHFFKQPTGKFEYVVSIDESVTFNDIVDNYEIVGQNEDGSWTLRDKE